MATEAAATLMAPSSSSSDLFNHIVIYDTISATPSTTNPHYDESFPFFFPPPPPPLHPPPTPQPPPSPPPPPPAEAKKSARGRSSSSSTGGSGGKKRRRKARVCKNKEEAETQRMTHIAVERNRRKLMNEHLALLRSLMPPSYVQRGDQASIVAGAIEFVKELEHVLHSLQAQKLQLLATTQHEIATPFAEFFNQTATTTSKITLPCKTILSSCTTTTTTTCSSSTTSSSYNNDETTTMNSKCDDGVADVEVTLIESHANLRILWRRSERKSTTTPSRLSRLVCGFHALGLGVLHFSLATVHPFALYSVSAKVEEGCQLSSVDDIAAAVHHMLRLLIEQEESPHPYNSALLPLTTL